MNSWGGGGVGLCGLEQMQTILGVPDPPPKKIIIYIYIYIYIIIHLHATLAVPDSRTARRASGQLVGRPDGYCARVATAQSWSHGHDVSQTR